MNFFLFLTFCGSRRQEFKTIEFRTVSFTRDLVRKRHVTCQVIFPISSSRTSYSTDLFVVSTIFCVKEFKTIKISIVTFQGC